jgi:hypothetical protein
MVHQQAQLDRWFLPSERSQNNSTEHTNNNNQLSTSINNNNQTSIVSQRHNRRRTRRRPTINYRQTSLRTTTQVTNEQPWGDEHTNKSLTDLRIAFRNINSLPQRATDSRNKELDTL